MDEARVAALRSTKLVSLVASTAGLDPSEVARPSGDSSLVATELRGRSFALAQRTGELGSILRWMVSRGTDGVTVFADTEAGSDTAGHLARRARLLTADVEVLTIVGASAMEAKPVLLPAPPAMSDGMWRAAAVMADVGARVVDDHGRLTGEVEGLEVARIEPAADDGEPVLQVGVGEADRQLQGYVHSHLDDLERLRRAVAIVREHRRPGSAAHPLTRLSRPRWLRSMLLTDPGAAGLTDLEPRPPVDPATGVYDREPAAAYSPSDQATVVCSVGVDLDLIPTAVDLRNRIDRESRLLLVLPDRDAELATSAVVHLVDNVEVVAVVPPWEQAARP